MDADRSLAGPRETLGPPPFSPSRRTVVAAAAFAHQPDVGFRNAASLPHRYSVVEPHPLLGSTLDATSVVSPPHEHPHPRRGHRVPSRPPSVPTFYALASPVRGFALPARGCRTSGKTSQ